ncbi:MAG: tRNA (adenosine(37)-N6)-threonylcarbamoyltransferase complex ATPase subunit type 1 TsaE [Candidatus Peribacteria bacterium]|nr:MAG: tRNA (adenosine(37)-N6)-threonylcarbamoyltransferase complex ATPase subunit type 1 TsaE [Candidatus Peribacteria bacterium]
MDHQQVKSPTYTYIQVYDDKLLHIDMRRIHDTETAREIGLRDLIDSYDYILVERPKFTSEWASTNWLQVHIQKLPDDRRLVETR